MTGNIVTTQADALRAFFARASWSRFLQRERRALPQMG